MLDRDPNPPRPPDSSSPRPRPRPHKPKNAPKKQPQRGLGVAQLEKLRLEEQSKQEAVCLASLRHHHRIHLQHQSQHQQQEQQPQQIHLRHHHQQQQLLQQQHHSQTPAFCLTRQIKFTEPSADKSSFAVISGFAEPPFPLPCAKLSGGHVLNSFIPLAGMASIRQTLPLPLQQQQQQQSGDESEPSQSPHDLCSPGSTFPSSAQGLLPPRLLRPDTLPLPAPLPPVLASGAPETPWHNRHSDRVSDDFFIKEQDSTIAIFSAACLSSTEKKMQGLAGDLCATAENVHATAGNLHATTGSLHVSAGNLHAQSKGSLAPFTDLCLRHRPEGAFDLHVPSRNRSEFPVVSIAPAGVHTRELSSFQTIPLRPAWSPVDQVSNRKRSWASTQEPARNTQTFKGVDLNTSADEIESESTERDTNIPVPSTTRACSECCSMASSALKVDISDTTLNGAAFLSLSKRNLDCDMQEVETSGEFLTLGPSCSSIRRLGNAHLGTGNSSSGPVMRKPSENASTWQPKKMFSEQAKGVGKLLPMVSRVGSSDGLMTMAEEYQANYVCTPLQMKVELSDFLAWNKAEGHPGHLQQSRPDESLNLELRLSI